MIHALVVNGKQRITKSISVCRYVTYRKTEIVIKGSETPQCFQVVKSLEIDYIFNRKAWMTCKVL